MSGPLAPMSVNQSVSCSRRVKTDKENPLALRSRSAVGETKMSSSSSEPVASTSDMDTSAMMDVDPNSSFSVIPNGNVPTDEVECIKSYKKLTTRINAIQINPETIGTSSKEVSDLLDESNKLALNAYQCSTVAPLYDSDLMAATGRTVSKLTQALEIDSRFFSTKTFANAFKKYLNLSINNRITNAHWVNFSNEQCHSIVHCLSAPIVSYMYGAGNFDKEPVASTSTAEEERPTVAYTAPVAKKPRNVYKLVVSNVRQSTALVNNEKALDKVEKDRTVIEVELLHERLTELYNRFEEPIPYLNAVVDEAEFGKTVENIFHLSFLVKEGFVCISVEDSPHGKLTVVRPIPVEERNNTDRQRSSAQVAFSFSEKHWQIWREKLKDAPFAHFRDQ